MDLKLDLTTKDIIFGGNEAVVTKGADVVAQRLFIRLRSLRGDWFLNTAYGVPYDKVLGQRVSKRTVDAILQEEIYKEVGVKQILYFKSTLEPVGRIYSCEFKVKTTSGEVTDIIEVGV